MSEVRRIPISRALQSKTDLPRNCHRSGVWAVEILPWTPVVLCCGCGCGCVVLCCGCGCVVLFVTHKCKNMKTKG